MHFLKKMGFLPYKTVVLCLGASNFPNSFSMERLDHHPRIIIGDQEYVPLDTVVAASSVVTRELILELVHSDEIDWTYLKREGDNDTKGLIIGIARDAAERILL